MDSLPEATLLSFGTELCPPARRMGQSLDEVEAVFDGRIRIRRIDVWESDQLADKYGVLFVPSCVLIVEGEEELRINGYYKPDDLVRKLSPHIAGGEDIEPIDARSASDLPFQNHLSAAVDAVLRALGIG